MTSELLDIDFSYPVYTLEKESKQQFFSKHILSLTLHHVMYCQAYRNFIDSHDIDPTILANEKSVENIPPLFANVFKHHQLLSIDEHEVFRVMHSSGTTGRQSTIYLDKGTAYLQSKALGKILQTVLGKQRLPILLVDSDQSSKRSTHLSARGAGLQGLALYGRDQTYLLDEQGKINWQVFDHFYKKYQHEPVVMFGFTFMVWRDLLERMENTGKQYSFDKLILLHSGGWKKLYDQAVSNDQFILTAKNFLGPNTQVHNFYGMVEQTGSIYMACEHGYFHAPLYADINIRHPRTFKILPAGSRGLIETLSILPRSYPGHALLTQDIGILIGEDDCLCGRKGKYFIVEGRQKQADIRGCSDSYG